MTGSELANFSAVELTRDGRRVTIRAVRPQDRGLLIDALRNVGPDSLYLRFFSKKAKFTDEELRRATDVDFTDVIALVAVMEEGGEDRIVGGGRYLRIGAPGPAQRAEVAFLIDDAHQGLGIGSHLFRHLAAIARAAGIVQFEAEVLPANQGMLQLFSRSGFPVTRRSSPDTVHVTIDLTARGAGMDAAGPAGPTRETDPTEPDRRVSRPPSSTEAPTRLVYGLVALPDLIRRLGVDPEPIFAAAGLDPRDLAEPSNRIPYQPLLQVLNDAAARTGCPHFGLLAGSTWQLRSMGVVGEVVRHSPTVGLALHELVTHQHLNAEGALAFLLHRNGQVDFGYAIYTPFAESTIQVYDAALAVAVNIMRELCGAGWNPTEVFLPHSAPADVAPFQQYFRSRLRFDSHFAAIRFPETWMAQPVAGADPARLRRARAQVDAAGKATLVQTVHRSLRTLLLQNKGLGADVAQALAMHRRTLNRRLRREGATFQTILDRVRFAVAKELLENSAIPLPRIAAALGYSEVASFIRAFRRWTGTTPGAWRGSA